MPRGGKRAGAGRPRELEGDGPRLDVDLDEPSGLGLLTYAQERGVTGPAAVRELLAAWHQSPAVRRAVEVWRKSR